MKSLPSSPNARPLLSFALFVSVVRSSAILELRRQCTVGHSEDNEQGRHDRGGARDDNAGDDAHFAVRIALGHPVRSAPYLQHTVQKSREKKNAETILE